MPWTIATSLAGLVEALNTDIVREVVAADRCLRLARLVQQLHNPALCRQAAVCAAAALSNATVLAAEVMALGGAPPASLRPGTTAIPAANSVEELLIDVRAELAHYRGRLLLSRRLGLVRLQEVFRDIVRSKRKLLAHAGVTASAIVMRTRTQGEIE